VVFERSGILPCLLVRPRPDLDQGGMCCFLDDVSFRQVRTHGGVSGGGHAVTGQDSVGLATQFAADVARQPAVTGPRIARTTGTRKALGGKGMARVVPAVALTTLSIVLLVLAVSGSVTFQGDFYGNLYVAGARIFHGLSPYQPQLIAAEAAIVRAGGTISSVSSPRYPAPMLVASAPLSLLPLWLAQVLVLVASIAAVIGALRLFGVRDWRCIAVACVSWPVVFGVWLGNVSPLLLLGTALVWRWRARLWPAAAALASLIAAKLFLWPIGVWVLVTRRFRTLGLAVLITVAAAAAGWALIGFNSLIEYPRLLMNIATIGEGRGCSLVGTLMSVGVSSGTARVVALVIMTALVGAAWRLAGLPDGERRAFGVTVMAVLIGTPVVWAHYLVLTFVPIALVSPELSWLWFLPMLAGIEPGPVAHPHLWVSLPALIIELVLVRSLCAPLLNRYHPASARTSALPVREPAPSGVRGAQIGGVHLGAGG
jgi:Glycosyltransferase family 87